MSTFSRCPTHATWTTCEELVAELQVATGGMLFGHTGFLVEVRPLATGGFIFSHVGCLAAEVVKMF